MTSLSDGHRAVGCPVNHGDASVREAKCPLVLSEQRVGRAEVCAEPRSQILTLLRLASDTRCSGISARCQQEQSYDKCLHSLNDTKARFVEQPNQLPQLVQGVEL